MRPSDWHVLDLDGDPTPGDPVTVRRLGRDWDGFADEVEAAERGVKSLAGDGAVLAWLGAAGSVFREAIGAFPQDLARCKDSYRAGARALTAWAVDLDGCQEQADRALAQGRAARADLDAATAALGAATTASGAAAREADRVSAVADRYAGSPPSSGVQAPDPAQVRAAVRTAETARARVTATQALVSDAQTRLDAARRLALDARALREDSGRGAARAIDDAAAVGIPPKSWWQSVKDAAAQAWDVTVTVAKVVVVVLGIVALIIGGPLAWVVLAAAVVLLADALAKYSRGEATAGDVAWALVGCIPGTKGLTTLSALRNATRVGGLAGGAGHVLTAGRTALTAMTASVRAAPTAFVAGVRSSAEAVVSLRNVVVARGDAGFLRFSGASIRRVRNIGDFAEEWADEAYDVIRGTDDIAAVHRSAQSHGFSVGDLQTIKQHVFYDEHQLDMFGDVGPMRRFDADPRIAEAWTRLSGGNPHPSDFRLLRHELYEARLMVESGDASYMRAHRATEAAGLRWDPEAAARDGLGYQPPER